MKPSVTAQIMRLTALLSMLISILFAVGFAADPTGLNDLFFRNASTGSGGLAGIATQEAKLAVAIAGGIFAGISGILLFVAAPAIEAGDRKTIRGVQISFLIWFIVDSSASTLGGNAVNVIPNIAALVLLTWPTVFVYKLQAPGTNA